MGAGPGAQAKEEKRDGGVVAGQSEWGKAGSVRGQERRRKRKSATAELSRGEANAARPGELRGRATRGGREKRKGGAAIRCLRRGAERAASGWSCGRKKGKLTSGPRLSAAPGGR
jgi:hypothetical protein